MTAVTRAIGVGSLVLYAFAAACGGSSDAQPHAAAHDATHTDSAKRSLAAASKAVELPLSVRDTSLESDTLRPLLIEGRKRKDSIAFSATVTFGRRMMKKWPASLTPLAGSILPSHRIVAFYGNPLSKRMGVLGEFPPDTMLAKLDTIVRQWEHADPSTPVQPALHLIAVVAQGAPGPDGMYRARMDSSMIENVYGWAKQRGAILFLDVQVGHSTMQRELPRLMPFLARPDVHLAMDAEFSMHYGKEGVVPGRRVGQFDAKDVNWVSEQLRELVTEKKLPPKLLIVHRYTKPMISNANAIVLDPRVQIVMHMDGWGPPWMKFESYRDYITLEPVEFTGFKLFFHNDVKRKDAMLTPSEVLWLRPRPMYIQYQ